jgi:hypothetical protein
MGTKNNPGEYDCYEKAKPDEPMFVLLARDEQAPDLVRTWATNRLVKEWKPGQEIPGKYTEAMECADAMEAWAWKEVNRDGS